MLNLDMHHEPCMVVQVQTIDKCLSSMQESKLYGAHFREISADAPKAKKITFNSDDED